MLKTTKTAKDAILLVLHGSHAYGLNTEESDQDIRGIIVEPVEEFISYHNNFEQIQQHQHDGFEQDITLFGLRKFIQLAAACNPNAIEILFVEPSEIIQKNKFGQKLIDNREMLLTKRVFFTFGGYAKSELSRLNGHRKWILNPPKPPPSREDFGLPSKPIINTNIAKGIQASISKKLDRWNLKDMSSQEYSDRIDIIYTMSECLAEMKIGTEDKWFSAGRIIGFDSNILESLNKEQQYDNIVSDYKQYINWMETRNRKRYETEVKCGCDAKNASHLIRLYLQCIDVLKGKGLILKRSKEDTTLLLDIKQGKYGKNTYDFIMELQVKLEEENQMALKASKLPNQIDTDKLDDIIRDIYLESWFGMNRNCIEIAKILFDNR